MIYIYESHLGGIYTTDYELDYETLYCEQCGDSDQLIGTIGTVGELLTVISDMVAYRSYPTEYIQEEINERYPELNITLPPLSVCTERDWKLIDDSEHPIYCNYFDSVCDCYEVDDYEDDCTMKPYCDECAKNYEYYLVKANPDLDAGMSI